MPLTRSAHLVATVTAAAGLAVGSLALTSNDPAAAATASELATYTCTTPAGVSFQLPATVSLTDLPDTLTAGVTFPAGVPFSLDLGADSLATALGTTVLAGNYAVNQVSTQVGSTAVTNAVTDPLLTQLGNGLLGVSGTLGSFTPYIGDLGLPVPTSFDLVPTVLGVPGVGANASCTFDPGSITPSASGSAGSGGGVTVVKQTATLKAHQIGRQARVLVKVKNQTSNATGKVVAKVHGKKVGKGKLKHGKIRLRLKRLPHGVTRVKLAYAGDAITQAAHATVKVRLVRHTQR